MKNNKLSEKNKEKKKPSFFYEEKKTVNLDKKEEGGFGDFLKSVGNFVMEVAETVISVLVIVFLIRYFLIQPFYVMGQSMEPNFKDGEYLIVDEISYRFTSPKRGDVIVFNYPKDPSKNYIKRIIGLPGEKVEVSDGRIIIYNKENPKGVQLKEPYIPADWETLGEVIEELDADDYFVIGDNRQPNASSDSREWGELARCNIIGKVWLRAWPLNHAGIVKHYNGDYNLATAK